MENSILIGSLVMGLTSLLSLAGVLIRTGKLVGQVEHLEGKIERLEAELHSKNTISEDWREVLMQRIGEMSMSIKVIETRMEFTTTPKP